MSKQRHSEAWEDINPPFHGKEKKKYSPPRVVTRKVAAEHFKNMHAAVNFQNHMEALRQ